jgi:hypothetical protein
MKDKLIAAVKEIHFSYDAFFITNKYGSEGGTHVEEFKLVKHNLVGDKCPNALAWIKDQWDCYYAEDSQLEDLNNPFGYLLDYINNNFKEE